MLHKAYLSQENQALWTGAPKLLQFDRKLGIAPEYVPHYELLKDIDYSSQCETLDQFSSDIETVSIKSFLNAVAKKEERIFLIKSPPGCGKTVLLRRLCAFWAQGFCLRRYTLVLWLDLKAHPTAPSNVSTRTLLSYCLPQGSDLDGIQKRLDRCGADDVLLMIDGVEGQAYDQWKLDQVLASSCLTTAPVILTVSSRQTLKLSYSQFDLLGLSEDQVLKQVIHHYHDASKAEEFLIYIYETPKIKALCSSPPYLAAVLFMFDKRNTNDPPNSWTQLFTGFALSLLELSGVADHSSLALLRSEAFAVTSTGSSLDWHPRNANFCSKVTPPYFAIVAQADSACFSLPLLHHYLSALHIETTLQMTQHMVANLYNETVVSIHMKQFYIGLCTSAEMVLNPKDMLSSAACIAEIPVERLQYLMSPQITITDQLLSAFDMDCIFHAVYHSGLTCCLRFGGGCFRPQMMMKWLRLNPVLSSGGTVQELR